ncbi:MAG: sigma-70 family RNA polymerase sigma factor [Planctomycetes bacterium]|nr:sigma-70 family RNA polymerase sigma factor [Planctomycetota bacterium]
MVASRTQPAVETLLSHEAFLRGLARTLLLDDNDIDDVVQQAWLKAVEQPPREAGALKGWLATVVRNLALNRKAQRRAARRREETVARPEAVPSTTEILDREATRAHVVRCAVALPEPYRGTILLRYFEGLEPKQIAARLGIPSATVRTRLKRALDLLRTDLDAEFDGDRSAWKLSLIPLAHPGRALSATSGSVMILGVMMNKTLLTTALALPLFAASLFVAVTVWSANDEPRLLPSTPLTSRENAKAQDRERATQPATTATTSVRTEAVEHASHDSDNWTVQNADGSPAAGLRYWITWNARLPKSREEALTITPPGDSQFTNPRGTLEFDRTETSSQGTLWIIARNDDRIGFDIRSDDSARAFTLPAFSTLSVACVGAAIDEPWRVHLDPAWTTEGDPERVFGRPSAPSTHGQAVVIRSGAELEAVGPHDLELEVLEGAEYRISASALSFVFEQADHLVTAPGRIVLRAGPPQRTLTVRVLDPGSMQPTKVSGRWVLREPTSSLSMPIEDGIARIGWGEFEAKDYELWVLMDDGEVFESGVAFGDRLTHEPIEFVRGKGNAPHRIRIRELGVDRENRVVLERANGSLATGQTVESLDFADTGSFGYRIDASGLELIAAPRDWRVAWILRRDGRVSRCTRIAAASSSIHESHGEWLEDRISREIPLRSVLDRFHIEKAHVRLELMLQPTGATAQWHLVDTVRIDANTASENTWQKHLPIGLPHRFVLRHFDGRLEVFDPWN